MTLRLQKANTDEFVDIKISWCGISTDKNGVYVRYIEKGLEFTPCGYYKEIRVNEYDIIHVLSN